MLRVSERLREVDAKAKRHGLVRTERDYLRALLDAMANMDRLVEVEVLKSLGDVNLEAGKLGKDAVKFERALALYRTALPRCENAEIRESLEHRKSYAEKLQAGKVSIASVSNKPSLVGVVEKFLNLDQNKGYSKDSLLIEYTKLMIEGIVNEDNILETEAIKSIGDVHLKKGTETRDTKCLTKATALYNTALARCEGLQGTVALIHRLLYTARIRQDMGKTRNKGSKHRGQQYQSHPSRDLPDTSASSDVIADTRHQQFMSPSAEYIRSQTSHRATPDYGLYEKHLTTGDRALTEGDLDLAEQKFASALKLIHDPNKPDRCKEADCLCRLGDVYTRRGKRTREGRQFTQAAALYNAAIARANKDRHKVMKSLQETEEWFLQCTINLKNKPSPSDSAIRHKKRLKDMRARARSQLEAINQQHNPYQYDEDDPTMITVEAKRAGAVKALCKTIAKDRQLFIQDLVDECIGTLGPPPCKYAFIGLGSQATELVTPYSDLEFAILIEDGKENVDTRRYFINLTHYLHLKVINLGETILPAMAIPSLNDFKSEDPEKNWFFDSVTPHGFAFDGFMPWASKTPFGRDKTKTKAPISLIQTPAEMTKFQELEVSLSEGYHLSDMLRRFVFLAGDEALVSEYMKMLKKVITEDLLSHFRTRRLSAFVMQHLLEIMGQNRAFESTGQLPNITQKDIANMGQICAFEPTGQLLNVKKDIYRFPGTAIELLAVYCNVTLLASTWDVIDEMKEAGWIHEEDASHLTVLTSISAELRLRTYMANGGQKDSLSPLAEYQTKTHEVSDTTLKSEFHIPDTKFLFRYYCRAIPLRMCIPDMIQGRKLQVQPRRVFETAIFDASDEWIGRIAGNFCLFRKSIHHLEAALRDADSDVKRSQILNDLGLSWAELGDQKKAISYHQKALTMKRIRYGNHTANPNIAMSLHNMALAHRKLGNYKEAINYHEQALTMTQAGDTDLAAACLNGLGSCWRRLGDHRKAIGYYEQFLTMTKALIGNNKAHLNPDIAGGLSNLGICWHELGDYNEAVRYWQESLTMTKAIYGHNTAHPDIASSLTKLGSAWRELGDQEKAIDYLEQSLRMLKTLHGETHPEIARTLLNLGTSWCIHDNHGKRGIEYCQQSLLMRKTIYGDNTPHPDIAMSLHNLGSCWSAFGDPKKAISYFEQALAMRKTIFGHSKEHPDIAKSLCSLGLSSSALGDEEKAITYYEQSLTMMEAVYGGDMTHPDIVGLLNSLGNSWHNLGDQKKAISYYERSLMKAKTIYGGNTAHLDIAKSLGNLGSSWQKLGNQKEAINYYEEYLTMMKTLYGENKAHSNIAGALNNLGMCWLIEGDQTKAVSYMKQSLTTYRTVYGNNTAHSDIAKLLTCLGMCFGTFGDQRKAIEYCQQSLEMTKTIHGNTMPASPEIALLLHTLGSCWSNLEDKEKANSYYEQARVVEFKLSQIHH